VNEGVLAAGVASVANTSGAFGNNSAMVMGTALSAGLNITGFNTQVGSLTGGGYGAGGVILGAATLSVGGDNSSPAAYLGPISGTGNVTKIGSGTWTVAGNSSYTGVTQIDGGTLDLGFRIANGGIASSMGKSSNAATNLVIGGGTLKYSGTEDAKTDRLFTIGSAAGDTAALDASGTGAGTLAFTNTGSIAFGNTNAHALTLTGTNTGNNSLAAIIGDNTGSTSLVKDGAGTWILSGANTYSGDTTITAGTLALGASGSIANSPNIIVGDAEASTAVLNVTAVSGGFTVGGTQTLSGSGSVTGGMVTVGSGAIVAPGAGIGTLNIGGGLTITDGGIFNWENNTVNSLGSGGTNWDVANVTGTTTISSTPSSGSKLKLLFTNALTSFSDSFWDTSKTWNFITGGVSAGNLFDTSNITVFVESLQQGLTNIITGEGFFSTAAVGNDVQLQWTADTSGAPEIKVEQGTEILNNGSQDFGTVVVGASASLTFTISNIGTADLTGLAITKSGTHAGDFSMTQVSPAAPVSGPTGTTTFTVTFSPLATGARTAAIHIASNDSDENPFTIIVTGDGTTAYDQWALSKNLIGLAGSDADPDFYADPDKDGIKNGLEWVLGGNPKQNDSPSVLPAVNVTGGSLIQTFKRAEASINETALIIEYGTNLVTWPKSVTVGANTAPADGNGVVVTVNAGLTPDEVIVNIPASGNAVGGKLFARMHLTRLPVP
jgi:fibronectin-binding autotransporter adhesin